MPRIQPLLAIAAILFVAACSSTPQGGAQLVSDPLEPVNRVVHGVNKGVDTVVLRPASQAYGVVVPEPVDRTLGNFTSNLALPSDIVNNALQGDTVALGDNLARFLMNTTLGLGGLLDVAGSTGIEREAADFGQTLAVWGVGEGPYLELPLLGPSTTRDAVGTAVDIVTNPLVLAGSDTLDDVVLYGTIVEVVDTRNENSQVIDQILYESEDSYLAAQTAYIQLRRAQISGGERSDEDFVDIYAE